MLFVVQLGARVPVASLGSRSGKEFVRVAPHWALRLSPPHHSCLLYWCLYICSNAGKHGSGHTQISAPHTEDQRSGVWQHGGGHSGDHGNRWAWTFDCSQTNNYMLLHHHTLTGSGRVCVCLSLYIYLSLYLNHCSSLHRSGENCISKLWDPGKTGKSDIL